MPGILFPATEKGDRSTTGFGKDVLRAAASALPGEEALSDAISKEKDWRHNYPKYFVQLLEAQAKADTSTALSSFKAGLQKAQALEFEKDAVGPLATAMATPPVDGHFDTATIKGSGSAVELEVPFEYSGCVLKGDTLAAQLGKWTNYGCMEQDCADAIKAGASKTASLKGRTFIIIGAGSELCPLKHLLQAGATVAALATRKPQRWEKLIEFTRGTAGTLLLPVAKGTDTAVDSTVAKAAGVDLMVDTPAVGEWVQRVVKESPGEVTIGTYLYVDGGANVCVTVASDYFIEAAAKAAGQKKVSFAWLGSPATVHVVPEAMAAAQKAGLGNASWWQKMTLGQKPPKTIQAKDGKDVCIFDGFAVMQGPNYAVAQHLRQWRAMLLHSEGFLVSTPMAPICRTESVIHNTTMKAALDGMYYLPPLEAFHPETASALLFAMLVSDLTEAAPSLRSPLDLFTRRSFHSGVWRCPFSFESAGKMLFVLGKVAGQSTPNKN